jgi:peptide/nickel transport system substrate-binding protein
MPILEEATYSTVVPVMEVMNNLVIYDQHIAQNSLNTIRPDLAESWSWSEDGTELSLSNCAPVSNGMTASRSPPRTSNALSIYCKARRGQATGSIRVRAGGTMVDNISADSDLQATFHLKRPQPALLTLLASGYSPIYPCHVSPAQMRQHPIRHRSFQFCRIQPNEYIQVTKNPRITEAGPAYRRGIEYDIVPNRSTAFSASPPSSST